MVMFILYYLYSNIILSALETNILLLLMLALMHHHFNLVSMKDVTATFQKEVTNTFEKPVMK